MKVKREVIQGRLVKGLGRITPGQVVELDGPLAKALDDLGITKPIKKQKEAPTDIVGGEEV